MGYFRALEAAGEKSKRAIDLCGEAIDLNSANYTVWAVRVSTSRPRLESARFQKFNLMKERRAFNLSTCGFNWELASLQHGVALQVGVRPRDGRGPRGGAQVRAGDGR